MFKEMTENADDRYDFSYEEGDSVVWEGTGGVTNKDIEEYLNGKDCSHLSEAQKGELRQELLGRVFSGISARAKEQIEYPFGRRDESVVADIGAALKKHGPAVFERNAEYRRNLIAKLMS